MVKRLAKFLLVGGLCTGIQYLVLIVLVEFWAWQPTLASTCGFVLSAGVNYALNRLFTFQSGVEHWRAIPKFVVVSCTGLLLNAAILQGVIESTDWPYMMGQIIATVLVLVWNFVGSLLWTFKSDRLPAGINKS